MVRINRVYTRKGDSGNTSLVGGQTIAKDHLRVECYGTVDELNCALGLARTFNRSDGNAEAGATPEGQKLEKLFAIVQQKLFDLGSQLATPPGATYEGQVLIVQADVDWLEESMDFLNRDLPALESFILPGGGPVSAFLHQARAICRRAERLAVALAREEELGAHAVPYLNRLSDWCFVVGRWAALKLGEREILWQPGIKPDESWK